MKLGLICSVSAVVLLSGCSMWQKKGPERYGLAPGAKRIPAMNPGGKLAGQTPPPVSQSQQQAEASRMVAPPAQAPQMMQQPAPYLPPQQAYVMPPPVQVAPPPQAMQQPMPTYQPPMANPPMPTASMAPPAAYPQMEAPMDLSSRTLDRGQGYPSLSQVPQASVNSTDRVTNAQNAANELQQEMMGSNAQRAMAQQQAVNDGMPWGSPPPVAPHAGVPRGGNMSLDEIDQRFSGSYQGGQPSMLPPQDMTSIAPSYNFPSPDGSSHMSNAAPALAPQAPLPTGQAELAPIKLVPPTFEPEEEGTIALDVPPMRQRFVPEPTDVSAMPEMPAIQAQQDIYVPPAPSIASSQGGWDEYAAPANAIVLTPPSEMYEAPSERGFLPESRYEKRRRFQRRKARF